MTTPLKALSVLLTISFLSACGGGGGGTDDGGSNVNDGDLNPAPQDENANGIWLGTTSNSTFGSSETIGLFNDGEFVAINLDFNEFYKGTYSIDQDDISATGKGYALNGPYGGTGVLDGVVNSQGTLTATVVASIGTTSDLSLAYATESYERPIAYSDFAGSWSGSVIGLSYNISIDASGDFIAVGSDGCNVSGNLVIPDSDRNLVKADLSVSGSSCTVTGSYSGFGVLADDDGSIIFGYANDNNGFAYIAYRNSDAGSNQRYKR